MYNITTIIPTYNRASKLKLAIKSVLAQTVRPKKILIIDNASTDETKLMVSEMMIGESSITYVRNDTNLGALDSFKKGVRLVDTEYFHLLGDDDWLIDSFYADATDCFKLSPEIGFYAGRTVNVTENLELQLSQPSVEYEFEKRSKIEKITDLILLHTPWTSIVFNSHYKNLFDLFSSYIIDYEYTVAIGLKYGYIQSNKLSAVYLVHLKNGAREIPIAKYLDGVYSLLELNANSFFGMDNSTEIRKNLHVRANMFIKTKIRLGVENGMRLRKIIDGARVNAKHPLLHLLLVYLFVYLGTAGNAMVKLAVKYKEKNRQAAEIGNGCDSNDVQIIKNQYKFIESF